MYAVAYYSISVTKFVLERGSVGKVGICVYVTACMSAFNMPGVHDKHLRNLKPRFLEMKPFAVYCDIISV